MLYLHHLQCDAYITCINKDTYTKYLDILSLCLFSPGILLSSCCYRFCFSSLVQRLVLSAVFKVSYFPFFNCCGGLLCYWKLRACLHGGGGPQVGEVTRLAVVEKWPAFTCKLTTPGFRGDFT